MAVTTGERLEGETIILIEWDLPIEVSITDKKTLLQVRDIVIRQSHALYQQGKLTPELASKATAILEVTKPFVEEEKL